MGQQAHGGPARNRTSKYPSACAPGGAYSVVTGGRARDQGGEGDVSALPLSYASRSSRRDSNPQPLDPESKYPSPTHRARSGVVEPLPRSEAASGWVLFFAERSSPWPSHRKGDESRRPGRGRRAQLNIRCSLTTGRAHDASAGPVPTGVPLKPPPHRWHRYSACRGHQFAPGLDGHGVQVCARPAGARIPRTSCTRRRSSAGRAGRTRHGRPGVGARPGRPSEQGPGTARLPGRPRHRAARVAGDLNGRGDLSI